MFFLHLAKVTCGLDSAILGESEIQRQVKISYEKAKHQQELCFPLHYLFQKALQCGKEIRAGYDIWKKDFSLEDLILEKIHHTFENPKKQRVLLIGNSETNRKLIRILISKGFSQITLMSRNPLQVALKDSIVESLSREHLSTWDQYPVGISATVELQALLETSEDTQRLVMDLSLPRTIHPSVNTLSKTELLNIEDLGSLFVIKKEIYRSEILQLEKKIKDKIKQRYEAYLAKQKRKVFFANYPRNSIDLSLIKKSKGALL